MSNIEKIKAEIESRIAFAEKCADAACEKNLHNALEANEMLIRQYKSLLAFIDSLPDENNPEPYNPVYDEDYLNEKIAKATKSWKGVDVDAMLAECRGYGGKPSEDLEKAAENYIAPIENDEGLDYINFNGRDIKDAFIAGAKWQKGQMMAEWLKDRDGCFWDGVNEGKKAMREQMMKDAVEGRAHPEECEIWVNLLGYGYKYKDGDKVKIIILKDAE